MGERPDYLPGDAALDRVERFIDEHAVTARTTGVGRIGSSGYLRFPLGECSGAANCEASPHIHGCYADLGDCDSPGEHNASSDAAS